MTNPPAPSSHAELRNAAEAARAALEMCRLMVENEISGLELSGRQLNAWPDLLTGCVSGGGINSALAQLGAVLNPPSES